MENLGSNVKTGLNNGGVVILHFRMELIPVAIVGNQQRQHAAVEQRVGKLRIGWRSTNPVAVGSSHVDGYPDFDHLLHL